MCNSISLYVVLCQCCYSYLSYLCQLISHTLSLFARMPVWVLSQSFICPACYLLISLVFSLWAVQLFVLFAGCLVLLLCFYLSACECFLWVFFIPLLPADFCFCCLLECEVYLQVQVVYSLPDDLTLSFSACMFHSIFSPICCLMTCLCLCLCL